MGANDDRLEDEDHVGQDALGLHDVSARFEGASRPAKICPLACFRQREERR